MIQSDLYGNIKSYSGNDYDATQVVVPTQLLEMPDGLNQQGWATMYDAKILNADLLISGEVVA